MRLMPLLPSAHPNSMNSEDVYAGTVMTSFYYTIIPARGNWFQTNHDRALLLCVLPMWKLWHFSCKIWSTLILSLYCGSVKPRRGRDIGSCKSLVRCYFQYLPKILALFLQKYTWKQLQFLSHWNNMEKNGTFSLFDTGVNGNVNVCIHNDVSLYQRIRRRREVIIK